MDPVREPDTRGKVAIALPHGTVHVALWADQVPQLARNFLSLAAAGAYNGTAITAIHPDMYITAGAVAGADVSSAADVAAGSAAGARPRIVSDPGIDPMGHSRLSISRRGILAMVRGPDGRVRSSFLLSLAALDSAADAAVVIGKIVDSTVYSLLPLADIPVNDDGVPDYPLSVTSVTVLENPFPDLVPAAHVAALIPPPASTALSATASTSSGKRKRRRKRIAPVKQQSLLSFNDEDDDDDGGASKRQKTQRTGPISSSHDVLLNDPDLAPAHPPTRPPQPATATAAAAAAATAAAAAPHPAEKPTHTGKPARTKSLRGRARAYVAKAKASRSDPDARAAATEAKLDRLKAMLAARKKKQGRR